MYALLGKFCVQVWDDVCMCVDTMSGTSTTTCRCLNSFLAISKSGPQSMHGLFGGIVR